jgi:hypothetical protein
MTARSGSSLVAKIFAAHGFDTGPEKVFSHGYETFENAEVNKWIAENKHRLNKVTGVPCRYVPGIEKIVKSNSVVKTEIEHAGLFCKLNPKVIAVKRNVRAISQSMADKRGKPWEAGGCVGGVKARLAGMDKIVAEWGGATVDTDELIAGDFTSIREAFEHHGLEFDESKARACVDPDKWHYK